MCLTGELRPHSPSLMTTLFHWAAQGLGWGPFSRAVGPGQNEKTLSSQDGHPQAGSWRGSRPELDPGPGSGRTWPMLENDPKGQSL